MACKYCENLKRQDDAKDEDYESYIGCSVEPSAAECKCSASLMMDVYKEYETPLTQWFIRFLVNEEWEHKLPITVGNYFYGDEVSTFTHTLKTGFDCSEWFEIEYCPFCGRKLGGGDE